MRDLRIASSCLAMRVIALGDAHGEEDCPRRHKHMFAAPEKVDYLVCLIVIHDVFKARVAFSARARYVWSKITAFICPESLIMWIVDKQYDSSIRIECQD